MANGRIESQEELQSYLASTPARERLTPGEIAAIVSSAVFDHGRFRGMFLGALSTKYSGEDIGALRAALGDPPIVSDCYPGGDGCSERPNCWCAHY